MTGPELTAALKRAKVTGARPVIAKLGRLFRNVAFLAALQDSGAKFTAADMPEADEFTIHILAAVAQRERKLTSDRTKAVLAAAKARGTRLGDPNRTAAIRRAELGAIVLKEWAASRLDYADMQEASNAVPLMRVPGPVAAASVWSTCASSGRLRRGGTRPLRCSVLAG